MSLPTTPTRHAPGAAALTLGRQCIAVGLPEPEYEVQFWPGRAFRWDVAWPAQHLAVEVQGGVWLAGGGKHNRGAGYEADCAKGNEAQIRGWVVLHVTPGQVADGQALRWVERAFARIEGRER